MLIITHLQLLFNEVLVYEVKRGTARPVHIPKFTTHTSSTPFVEKDRVEEARFDLQAPSFGDLISP